MRTIHILGILILLALVLPAAPAHAGGVVTVCDEAHLLAALAGGGTVTFACSGTIILSAEIVISADTTIDGSGQSVTFSGNNATRAFTVNEGVVLDLNRVTIANGFAQYGGGILNNGTLTVRNSTFAGNHGTHYGGGIGNGGGTAIVDHCTFIANSAGYGGGSIDTDNGELVVTNSTFSNNSAPRGGSIRNDSFKMSISNTTFSGNYATEDGGAICGLERSDVSNSTFLGNSAHNGGAIYTGWGAGSAHVSNSTFAGNTSSGLGGGIYINGIQTVVSTSTFAGNSADLGGGIFDAYGTTILQNTIVASSPTGSNCFGAITDGGGNLSYPDTTCPGINADPLLGPLQNNGGPTETMALGPGSAAIDAADDAICAAPPVNNLDQRGVTRPQGAHCDIGAVEQILEPAAVSVSALSAQSLPGTITPAMVAGLLLAALVGVGVRRRHRHMI